MDTFIELITTIDAYVWGVPMIVLLLGSHLYLTFRTRFIQLKLPQAIKLSVTQDPDAQGDISQFGALCTALSATVGTGNIIGVGTAIASGGPGAVFWMWLTGIFGMATKYAETFLAIKYRVKDHNSEMMGGAMYIWRRAFSKKDSKNKNSENINSPVWAHIGAASFAIFAVIASFGIGSAVQASAIGESLTQINSDVPQWIYALIITFFSAIVVFGSVKIVSKVCEALVPVMCITYFIGCIFILCFNWNYILPTITLIVESAFTGKAAFGGLVGSGVAAALQFGCARGLFSNESGLGSAPIVASAAATRNPGRQSLVAMTGTFWSTVVICLLTGLVIVSTMLSNEELLIQYCQQDGFILDGSKLTAYTFSQIPFGNIVLLIGLSLFAYSTIIGWSYYGNRCVSYLFGKYSIIPYKIVYVLLGFFGACGLGEIFWKISDITNALMCIPNIIVVLILSGILAKETKYYVWDNHLDEYDNEKIPIIDSR